MIEKLIKILLVNSLFFTVNISQTINYSIPKGIDNYKQIKKAKKLLDKNRFVKCVKELTELNEQSYYSEIVLFEFYMKQNDIEKAEKLMKYTISQDITKNEFEFGLIQLINLYNCNGDTLNWLNNLERLNEHNPSNETYYTQLATYYTLLNDTSNLFKTLNKALLETKNNDFYLQIINHKLENNDFKSLMFYMKEYEEIQSIRGYLYYYVKAKLMLNTYELNEDVMSLIEIYINTSIKAGGLYTDDRLGIIKLQNTFNSLRC